MTISRILIAASIAVAASANIVSAGKIVAPGVSPVKVVKAQLAIKSPIVNVCPTTAKMTGWIFTSKPGTIQYMLARKGGQVSGPYTIESKKGANGLSMASFSQNLDVLQKTDAEYRILVGENYGKTLSNWAPLKASCKIQLGG